MNDRLVSLRLLFALLVSIALASIARGLESPAGQKFDFIINLKFAKQINLTIPRNMLAGRDQNNDALGHQSNLWAELR